MDINYIQVLIAGFVGMAVGFLWYGPVFGKIWIRLSKFTKEDMEKAQSQGMAKYYVAAFVGSLVTAYVLAMFLSLIGASGLVASLQVAFWAWLGFVVTTLLSSLLWEGKPFKLFLLNIAYYLVMLFGMAVVLSL